MESIYQDYYVPAFEIKIEGKNILGEGMEITGVTVDYTVIEGADGFSFSVNNAFDIIKKDFNWLDKYLAIGKKVEIKIGYANNMKVMIKGSITAVDFSFPSGGFPQVNVRGMDTITHLMMQGSNSYSWNNIKDSDVVRTIASKYNLNASEIEETEILHKVTQDRESDYNLLSKLAKRNDFDFFIFDETIIFRDPANRKKMELTLEWGKNLLSFSPQVNISQQVSKIEVRGWDAVAKKVIVSKAGLGDETGMEDGESSGGELAMVSLGMNEKVEHIGEPAESQAEADLKAKTEYNQRAKKLVTGNGESIGFPELIPGSYLKLEGLGKVFSRTYYITGTQHSISNSGYRTTFNFEGKKI